jgi:phosphotransferase system enzyme I (PtsI)
MTNPERTDKSRDADGAETSDAETNRLVTGIGVSGGVAIGQVVLVERVSTEIYPQRILHAEEVPDETERFELAVREAETQLKQIKTLIKPGHPLEDHKYILDAHVMLLRDQMFFEGTKRSITQERQNAEWALAETMTGISAAFDTIEDEYLRERARDVHSVGERVLGILMGRKDDGGIHKLPPNSIIVSHDLSPADTAQVQTAGILGFAIDMGGRTSHTAIMARSLKLPAVTGLERISRQVHTGDTIIIDGSTGAAIINPDPETIFRYRERQEVYGNYHKNLLAFGRLPAVTSDGAFSTRILANIELMDEIQIARHHGAEGIGLFRTEYLFLGRKDLPSEEEQYDAYRQVMEANADKPVTIRTLDVGADKFASNLNLANETNPAMGLRAIRLCLDKTDLFRTQLRAILRASAHGSCRILIPMISCLPELRATRTLLEEEMENLDRSGLQFDPEIGLGILVEVPSAAAIADLLAREADFFSIGTNDLIQYALAIDRVNEHVNYLYDTLHPAVLRMIRQIANAGEAHGIPVAMCGEMAGDPVNAPILLGMGLNELSMNALSIPMVKKLIRSISIHECQELTVRAFEMTTAHEIRGFLEEWIRERFPQDYFVSES